MKNNFLEEPPDAKSLNRKTLPPLYLQKTSHNLDKFSEQNELRFTLRALRHLSSWEQS